jgi:hypothetical protein
MRRLAYNAAGLAFSRYGDHRSIGEFINLVDWDRGKAPEGIVKVLKLSKQTEKRGL